MKLIPVLWLSPLLFSADPAHFGNIRQLTRGGQNAEAYWSPDGKRLIFQSTRKGYECDQIFIMNADGSNQKLVSTGKGRTTCGYFLADGKHIVYASTHAAGEACPPSPDRSKGYVWGVFPGYDIYLATDDGRIQKKLTDATGYDAEATVNWKTGRIVYSKLVWRANHPKTSETMTRYKELLAENLTAPMKMELMIADADGKNPRQITNYGCASFAPSFTPDGKKIIFSSNKNECDSRHFELFLINVDGTGLEQVTNFGGFTSFAEFSPDGKKLVFCSDRDAKERYEFNIFTADWK
jgi:Tol biopolymer transport system component